MNPALRAAATGMVAQQQRVEVISNNLANVNTTGFKSSRARFEDLLYQQVQGPAALGGQDAQATEAIQVGRGTRLAAVQRVDGQGPIEQTSRPLDVAIEGAGFFQVALPDGRTAYTRDGSFTISDSGMLVTHGGYALQPGITIPTEATSVTVSRTGIVTVQMADSAEPAEVGRLELARFPNAPGLESIGENLLVETVAAGTAQRGYPQEDGFGRLIQGSLEGSNVEVVQEMVEMIAALRAYEVNSKAVKAGEEMSQIANGLLR